MVSPGLGRAERTVLLGSANLTSRALEDNLEAGLLVRDPAVARSLVAHVDALVAAGFLAVAG